MLKFIHNHGDFFTSNYFDDNLISKVKAKSGYAEEDLKELQKKVGRLKEDYFTFKKEYIGLRRPKDKINATYKFHTKLLTALGYDAEPTDYKELFLLNDEQGIPVRHKLYRADHPHLFVMEMQAMVQEGDVPPKGLFEQKYIDEDPENDQVKLEFSQRSQRYTASQWEGVFQVPEDINISPAIINQAIGELFLLDQKERPQYVLLLAGNQVFLMRDDKWGRGSYLQFDLEMLFDEASHNKGYYALLYFMLSKEKLAPDADVILMDQLDEESHKSAYAVTKDLKEGVIKAVEGLANEAVYYLSKNSPRINSWAEDGASTAHDFNRGLTDDASLAHDFNHGNTNVSLNADDLKNDCLTVVYRLLFIFFAESRPELGILPMDDEVYKKGYSLDMLRDLEQTPLNTDAHRNGYFFHDSIAQLFALLKGGYRKEDVINKTGNNRSFSMKPLDSPMFDDGHFKVLEGVRFRNHVWQEIIQQLSLSQKQKGKQRGRISYANLGVNQLGSVYESLLAFRGFFAEEEMIEVHRAKKAKETSEKVVREDGSFLVPRSRRDEFKETEIYQEENGEDKRILQGTFLYRLSGRDRQKSASFYTPEVLTQTTVKYTLKPILERLEKGEIRAKDLLEMKVLEPAMGAAAFHNEVINQLAEVYLETRQKEKKEKGDNNWKVPPGKYQQGELQKVKAYIATNNVYGMDLNPTAVELGKLSLWLNVIHKGMEPPFFGYRLGAGNATVGAWLRAYKKDDIEFVPVGKTGKKWEKKEWWTKAPRKLSFLKGEGTINRKEGEVYHFLLADKGMLAAADHKELSKRFPEASKKAKEMRTEWLQPARADERQRLARISAKIDTLLVDWSEQQKAINRLTASTEKIWGMRESHDEQMALDTTDYEQKERLIQTRDLSNSPYHKIKRVMDYWCALWYWDLKDIEDLPTRTQWLTDIEAILSLSTAHDFNRGSTMEANHDTHNEQRGLRSKTSQRDFEKRVLDQAKKLKSGQLTLGQEHTSLRQERIAEMAQRYRYFHPQLEFVEVFQDRGGFDVIVGNPPWVKLEFEEKGVISEKNPEVLIRKVSAPQVRKLKEGLLAEDPHLASLFDEELYEYLGGSAFLNALQNFPLLKGQQTNLYKCILENAFGLLAQQGFAGLVHPEGTYDDPKGGRMREEIYQRLKYHFQFRNELVLFAEVMHTRNYGIHIYKGLNQKVSFDSINNLFHPSTITGCYTHNGSGMCGGFKVKDEQTGKMSWNVKPHKDRIIHFTEKQLNILAQTFENSSNGKQPKLVSIHSKQIINVLEKLSKFKGKVEDVDSYTTVCWDETNAVNAEIIKRKTKFPNLQECELIYSGPHFFVANPFNKIPREVCNKSSDYDTVDLNIEDVISKDFLPRTNYVPAEDLRQFRNRIKGLENGKEWIEEYKVCFSKMLDVAVERTLQPSIIPPKVSHVHGVISMVFNSDDSAIEFSGLCASSVIDFYIKTLGKSNIGSDIFRSMPLGINKKFYPHLALRTLLLNCLTKPYADLWERNYDPTWNSMQWSKTDHRLPSFANLKQTWEWSTPLRTYYARRWALVEIDVITAMALGLTLEELQLIYNVQFPVLQQNEDDTWYDQNGKIVYTVSRGLNGVGISNDPEDKKFWKSIKDKKEGQFKYTIEKSEMYKGQEVVYQAPFEKCDRLKDYEVAWGYFEGVFNKN
ncbi:Eco57I restriction-modification methylase domain-containing protein [Flammeovirga sp. OC4]|uniref:Eco57I restriction-modification methylase domain-containing protein n=1 Tax=Flammeovirga sp. OC4 TaxID=1382345 RepID=UPI0005C66B14|nr:hypothetical protein [Flammeovirga sp. OC4]